MKRRSLKWKLTLWFTVFLTLISLVIVFTAAAMYRVSDSRQIRRNLVEVVREHSRQMERAAPPEQDRTGTGKKKGAPSEEDTWDNRSFFQDEIQLMVYHSDGSQAYGLFLHEEFNDVPFSDAREPQELKIDGRTYYYYDERLKNSDEDGMWMRGVAYAKGNTAQLLRSHWYVAVVLPLLIVLAFFGGYWLTGRFLKPVQQISQTAEEIRTSGDLTKRIPFQDNGDELSELARTFNAMFERVEENFQAETRFTSNASHELRTPVAVIMAQCEYALDNAQSEEELYDAIAAVQKQGYRMSHLIETLLVFTRMEQDTEKYPRAETDISALVESVCEDFRLIAERNISVTEHCPPGIAARVNRELMILLLNNLIQNAIRYGRDNGSVQVALSEKGDELCLQVKDDGVGIAEQDLNRIWERFYRSDRSRSTRGLGLGLSLVKQIAEYHGGSASVESRPGQGSTFTVKIKK